LRFSKALFFGFWRVGGLGVAFGMSSSCLSSFLSKHLQTIEDEENIPPDPRLNFI